MCEAKFICWSRWLDQEVDIYKRNNQPPTAFADIVHPTSTRCDGWDEQEDIRKVLNVNVAFKESRVNDFSGNRHDDGENPEEPVIAASCATTEYCVVLECESDGVIHT